MINYFYFYCCTSFLITPSNNAVIAEPTAQETTYIRGFPTVANTKIPPCGAINVHPNNADKNPATPAPTSVQGMTCNGSDAANGIAPSVIKEAPITRFETFELRSATVNFFGKNQHASAIPIGGTRPPTMMHAIAI